MSELQSDGSIIETNCRFYFLKQAFLNANVRKQPLNNNHHILIEQRNRDSRLGECRVNVVNRPIIMKVMAVTPSVYEAAVLAT